MAFHPFSERFANCHVCHLPSRLDYITEGTVWQEKKTQPRQGLSPTELKGKAVRNMITLELIFKLLAITMLVLWLLAMTKIAIDILFH